MVPVALALSLSPLPPPSTPARAPSKLSAPSPKRPFTLFRRQEGRINYRQRQEAGETVARYFVLDAERRWLRKSAMGAGDEGRRGGAGDARGIAGSGSGSGRGRFALKKGVIDMVGVASSAILGRRGLPAAVTSTSSSSSSSSSSSFTSSSHRRRHPLRRIRSTPHRVRRTSLCSLVPSDIRAACPA